MSDPVLTALKAQMEDKRNRIQKVLDIINYTSYSIPNLKGMISGYDDCIAIVKEFMGENYAKDKLEKPLELFIGIKSVLDVKNFNSTFCTDAYDDIKNVRDHRKLIKDDLIKEVLSLIVHPDNTITGRVICNPNWMERVLYPFVGR